MKPIHLISGDETLLVQEARDALIKNARQKGFTGHEFHTVDKSFKWQRLYATTHSMSLFDDKSIIELRMPSPKPGNAGSAAIVDYTKNPVPDKLLLIVTSKIDGATKRSKWFKAIEQAGQTQIIWPLDARDLPSWIQKRLQSAELTTDRTGIKVIMNATEGNLLATAQGIEKLRLLYGPGNLTADQIATAIADNARFDVFKLVDSIHSGDGVHTIRVLNRLREEGAEPMLILWAIAREMRTIINVHHAIKKGTPAPMALKQNGVWDKRQPLFQQSLRRQPVAQLTKLLANAEKIDRTIKGLHKANVWDELSTLSLILCGKTLPTIAQQ